MSEKRNNAAVCNESLYRYPGYKYTKRGTDIFLITLNCANEFIRPMSELIPIDCFTTNCFVKKIININTGKEVYAVSGRAYHDFDYFVGQVINGTSIYYSKFRVALYVVVLCEDPFTGQILDVHSLKNRHMQKEIIPGFASEIVRIIKTENSRKKAFYKVNELLLMKEKELFPDENRTIDEAMHLDKLQLENMPPEIRNGAATIEALETYWKIVGEYLDLKHWGKRFSE